MQNTLLTLLARVHAAPLNSRIKLVDCGRVELLTEQGCHFVNSLCNYFLLYFYNTIKQDTVCFSQPKSEIFWFAVSILKLVRGKGIEPLTTGWKPVILPLNEPRINLVGGLGIEPSSSALQADAGITRLAHPPKTFRIVLSQQ